MYRLDLGHQEEKPKLIYPGGEEIPTQNTSYWFAETTKKMFCYRKNEFRIACGEDLASNIMPF